MSESIGAYPALYSLVNKRFSCRAYSPRPLPRDVIVAILDIARLAPSATNRQPWTFLVIDTPELCAEVCGCYGRSWAQTAPAFVAVCGHHADAWHRPADGKDHTDIDAAIATEHICLGAASLGVGSCWICNFEPDALRRVLGTPDDVEPVALVALGYPAEGTVVPPKIRKNIEEVVKWGKF